jgi:quinolinate synthase
VGKLSKSLDKANMGIVAHYYMDVELQGTLQAIGRKQALDKFNLALDDGESISQEDIERIATQDINTMDTRVSIADSLAMGDHAVRMCQGGATSIACLGVDFMAESVSAILTQNGFGHVPVYRATARAIGCSLAESAERDSYRAWLQKAAQEDCPVLHVVYINTSLETKAISASIVPTITCTSSNVLKTILQASTQIGPELKIYYGPDTYMGENLVTMLDTIIQNQWDDERIGKELHPAHNRESIVKLRNKIDVFPNGNCVVHHMFGTNVVEKVQNTYDDCFVTAHLEVPGEMFQIAMERSLYDKGVVGSTSDILKFIARKVNETANEKSSTPRRLKFILGTEAGMVTSIVRAVQAILDVRKCRNVEAEIIFPVAADAVTAVEGDADLSIVPGVSGGEGCSTAGGCATCPFMKMNELDALSDVIDMVISGSNEKELKRHLPPQRLVGKMLNGKDAIELGVEPIQFMRGLMKGGTLPPQLVQRILTDEA